SLVLVCERHGSEGKHLLALGAHGRDVPLVASGGGNKLEAELTGGGVDHDHGVPAVVAGDPGDERARLRRADPDCLVLIAVALIADEDVVAAIDQGHARLIADADVFRPETFLEGFGTDGSVVVSSLVVLESLKAECDVEIAGADIGECTGSARRVAVASQVEPESVGPEGGVI